MHDTRATILSAIADGPVSGTDLAENLGVTRMAVWKHIEAFREAGFRINSGEDGYDLVSVPEFGGSVVEFGLEAPFGVEYHDSIGSTNDRARELASGSAKDIVVLADEQTGGRGRLDRQWISPSGGVWLSILLRPEIAPASASLFTLAAAVATAQAAREVGLDAGIKWPNDVTVNDRKLAGILLEMEGEADRITWLIVGIGVNANVYPEDVSKSQDATSLLAECGTTIDRRRFTQNLLEAFDDLRNNLQMVLPNWRDLAVTLGQRVRVETPRATIEGKAVDITDTGALIIDSGDARQTVMAGDCEHLYPA